MTFIEFQFIIILTEQVIGRYIQMTSMLEVLKGRLPDGLTIVSTKEMNSKYRIEFEYEGTRGTAELPKSCAPDCHNDVADYAIKTVMSEILMKKGDYIEAKSWLRK